MFHKLEKPLTREHDRGYYTKLTYISVQYEDGRICEYDSKSKIECGINFEVICTTSTGY